MKWESKCRCLRYERIIVVIVHWSHSNNNNNNGVSSNLQPLALFLHCSIPHTVQKVRKNAKGK